MTNKRFNALLFYIIFTAACLAVLGFVWLSITFTFPCDSLEDQRPCAEVVPRFFATRWLLPIGGVWAIATWVVFRRRTKR